MTVGTTFPSIHGKEPCQPLLTSCHAHHSYDTSSLKKKLSLPTLQGDDDEVVLVEVAEDVVERAVVEASEDMEVSRREEEFGREDVPSAF